MWTALLGTDAKKIPTYHADQVALRVVFLEIGPLAVRALLFEAEPSGIFRHHRFYRPTAPFAAEIPPILRKLVEKLVY